VGTLQQAPQSEESSSRSYHRFGLLLDAGVPDGLGVSLAFRPAHWLRLQLGVLENTASAGVRAGVTWLPLDYWITPTLTLEGAHYFEGNANSLVRRFSNNLGADKSILNDFNYDFVNAHVGLEIGGRRFAFYLRVGESYVSTTLRNVQPFLQQQATGNVVVESAQNIKASYRGPSAKLGFVLYFM
jgi:hypothetical protein